VDLDAWWSGLATPYRFNSRVPLGSRTVNEGAFVLSGRTM